MSGPSERYEIIEAKGDWWRARHRELGSEHLLKKAPENASKEQIAAFRHGAQIQARVVHPALLRVTDLLQMEQSPALIADAVELRSLRERLMVGPLPVAEALKALKSLAQGIGALHSTGYVHRGLSSDGVLWCEGQPKISDCSSALKQRPPKELAACAAPEQFSGLGDGRVDMWALGWLFFEMLTANPPFPPGTEGDLNRRMDTSNVPPSLIPILERCLHPKPANRYPHAQALLNALDALEPRSVPAPAPAPAPVAPVVAPVVAASVVAAPAPVPAPTPVIVENVPAPRPEADVSIRWGPLLGMLALGGFLAVTCLGGGVATWLYYGQGAQPLAVAMPSKPHSDTGKPPPPPAAPLEATKSPETPETKASDTKVADAKAPDAKVSDVKAPEVKKTETKVPEAEPPAPPPAETPSGPLTIVHFKGDTVPMTVEVTCRTGFRTRATVSNGEVTLSGLPSNIECLMYMKGVVASAAPVHAGSVITCEVRGTTTSCR